MSQYKNRKNFANLCCHEQDFEMSAEWHFFVTSHGKGPCDGVVGRSSVLQPELVYSGHTRCKSYSTPAIQVWLCCNTNSELSLYICWRPQTRINPSLKKIWINKNNCRYASLSQFSSDIRCQAWGPRFFSKRRKAHRMCVCEQQHHV